MRLTAATLTVAEGERILAEHRLHEISARDGEDQGWRVLPLVPAGHPAVNADPYLRMNDVLSGLEVRGGGGLFRRRLVAWSVSGGASRVANLRDESPTSRRGSTGGDDVLADGCIGDVQLALHPSRCWCMLGWVGSQLCD